eukprot:gb/GEZN01000880.1/.p1 GENE.gb/GEZN01000880.1/~~gb/GEZN01000880.1/.p1  ORF type:complete len:1025 (-),score=234.33 gb/GEZN01000880.1/:362-3436(-)
MLADNNLFAQKTKNDECAKQAIAIVLLAVVTLGVVGVFWCLLYSWLGLGAPSLFASTAFQGKRFLVPIAVSFRGQGSVDEPMVSLCSLDVERYKANPALLPMFRDLVKASSCSEANTVQMSMSALEQDLQHTTFHSSSSTLLYNSATQLEQDPQQHGQQSIDTTQRRKTRQQEEDDEEAGAVTGSSDLQTLDPAGFIFQESRCGSTLVANMLAAVGSQLVWSESSPPAEIARHCTECTTQQQVRYLRVVIRAMTRVAPLLYPPGRTFFKLQSVLTLHIPLFQQAFPHTPWLFLQRQPVQVLMSHLPAGLPHHAAPCLRSRGSTQARAIRHWAAEHGLKSQELERSDELWCAGHLAQLANSALNSSKTQPELFSLLDYSELPSALPGLLCEHWGISLSTSEQQAMLAVASVYSKSRNKASKEEQGGKRWQDDTQEKEQAASAAVRKAAEQLLEPVYRTLQTRANQSRTAIAASVSSISSSSFGSSLSSSSLPSLIPAMCARRRKQLAALIAGSSSSSSSSSFPSLPSSSSSFSPSSIVLSSSLPSASRRKKQTGLWDWFFPGTSSTVVSPDSVYGAEEEGKELDIKMQPESADERAEFQALLQTDYQTVRKKYGLTRPELCKVTDLLTEWPPTDANIPSDERLRIAKGSKGTLPRFDFRVRQERMAAWRHVRAELPFLLTHHPVFVKAAKTWTVPYLLDQFGNTVSTVVKSSSNQFMYYNRMEAKKKGWDVEKLPTSTEKGEFREFVDFVKNRPPPNASQPHWYFMANAPQPMSNIWIQQDLSPAFLTPEHSSGKPNASLFVVEPDKHGSIQCRFGHHGVEAAAHFDGGRNFIALMRGAKRYLLTPPESCQHLHLYPTGHPHSRHSKVNWDDPSEWDQYQGFEKAQGTQVILRPGQVLFVPSFWFHFIVTVGYEISAQCNTRAGISPPDRDTMERCGFHVGPTSSFKQKNQAEGSNKKEEGGHEEDSAEWDAEAEVGASPRDKRELGKAGGRMFAGGKRKKSVGVDKMNALQLELLWKFSRREGF